MRRLTISLACAGLLTAGALGQDTDDAKEAKVRELLKLTKADEMGMQALDRMLTQLRQTPGISPEFLDRFRKMCKPEDLVGLIVPIYMKHFDEQTLDAALVFYRSPAGRAVVEKMPVIAQEAMAAGVEWGKRMAMKAMAGSYDYEAHKIDDLNSVKQLVALLVTQREIPMKDGRVDVYSLVRKGDIREKQFDLLRSARFQQGPTKEAILAGDYGKFPYERFRGTVDPSKVVPLLWDKRPDEKGGRVVGMSDGAVRYMEEEEVQKLLREHGQIETAEEPEEPR